MDIDKAQSLEEGGFSSQGSADRVEGALLSLVTRRREYKDTGVNFSSERALVELLNELGAASSSHIGLNRDSLG